jgi:hypothetical protein
MPSLLTEVEKNNLTPLLEDLFDTFARDIIVHKEPKKIVINSSTNSLAGYDDSSNENNFTYIPENKTFKAKVKYENAQDIEASKTLEGFPNLLTQGLVKIKVRKDAKDYISDGKVERIEIDGKSFNLTTAAAVKKFFNVTFYVYFLKETK